MANSAAQFDIVNGQVSFTHRHASVFSFPDDNLCKYQLIFTKLGVCIGIIEIWFVSSVAKFITAYEESQ